MSQAAAQSVIGGVRDLLPTFRDRADEAERLRVVPEASIKELEEVGFFRLLQPQRFDGLEADPVTFYTAVRDIASACGSTGWVASVVGVHPWQVALFADEAQQAVWGEDTNTRLSSSYAPTGKATVTEGGYTLSGKWSFSSGCDHCTWVLLGGLVFNEDGNVVDFKTFMLPRKDYPINDVWHMIGLSGTGSNDIVVEDVFVPEAFTLSMGETGQCRGPGQDRTLRPLQAPVPLDLHRHHHHADHRHGRGRLRRARRDAAEAHPRRLPRREGLARPVRGGPDRQGVLEIDAAWALLVNNIREEQDHVAKGEQIPLKVRLKVRRDQVLGSQRAIDAIDSLFEASGGRALTEGTPLQRAGATPTPAGCTPPTTPSGRCRCTAPTQFGHKIDPGMS